MPVLPTGTVTFLFTDVEGSTRLWEEHPAAMRAAMARHDTVLRLAVLAHGGHIVKTTGDGLHAAFARAPDALRAAIEGQRALSLEESDLPRPLTARMALHTGVSHERDGDYFGPAVNRAARLMSVAHGGQVILSSTTAALARGDLSEGAALRDLGEHRLRGLGDAEHIFQLIWPGASVDFPPLKSLDTLPNNLPAQLTSFVGREREQGELRALLERSRLVTLTGAGGVGKTRLAVQVAADLVGTYADGVWFVDLAPVAESGMVAQTVLGALGAQDAAGRGARAALLDYLAEREALLLLDNCEHLVADCAQLVAALLRACPRTRILATSRELLGLAGETSWRVPSLPLPDGADQAGRPLEFDAVRLFVERARGVQPGFDVTERNAAALVQVCRRLDGIPLALELAAARTRVLSIEQIAERLDDRFRLLTGGARGALPRQQTLRALVDWSYDLLTEPERVLLRRLSVFAGAFRIEAAEAVTAFPPLAAADVLDRLTGLVDKSLVAVEERTDAAWYRLLETVRQYAGERLAEAEEVATTRDRHLAFYGEIAARGAAEMRGSGFIEWINRLEAEHDNLRAAVRWARERGDAAAALGLAGNLWLFWNEHGHQTEARATIEAALAMPGADAVRAGRARALVGAGWFAVVQGDREAADRRSAESIEVARQEGEGRTLVEAVIRRVVSVSTPERRAADEAAREALALAEELAYPFGTALALLTLSSTALKWGDLESARSCSERGIQIAREAGNPWLEVVHMRPLGRVALLEGRHAEARVIFERRKVLWQAIGSPRGLGVNADNLGIAALGLGDFATATAELRQALILLRRVGDPPLIAHSLLNLASVAAALGNAHRALRLAGAVEAVGARLGLADAAVEAVDSRWLESARSALSPEQREAALAAGRAMTLEQAVAYALSDED